MEDREGMMGKASRNKGKRYERELANLFKEYGWDEAKRHLEYQAAEAEEGRDLDGTQPFSVQAKCWQRTPSISVLETVTTTEEYPIRLAFLKRSKVGQTPLEVVVMDVKVFMEMVRRLDNYFDMDWEIFVEDIIDD